MYRTLAKFYEKLNDNCDQTHWSHYLISLLGKYSGRPPRVLEGGDLGCGTGKLTELLAKQTKIAVACDLSAEMLREAEKRLFPYRIPSLLCDFRAFKAPHRLDFLNVANDGLNYIPQSELGKLFRSLSASLKKGGILLFDLSSEYKLRNILGDNVFYDDREELSMFWKNTLFTDRVELSLTFFERTLESGKELWSRSEEFQTQYVHQSQNVRSELLKNGFSEVFVFDCFTEDGEREDGERIQFVAMR